MTFALVLNLAVAGLLYGSGRHQRLFARAVPKKVAWPICGAFLVVAMYFVNRHHDLATAVFTVGTLQMAALSLLPLAAAYLRSEPGS